MTDAVDELREITADDWADFRAVRLRALADAPTAFGMTLEESSKLPEEGWRERAGTPYPTWIGYAEGAPVAMGGVFAPEDIGFVWGMWTAPEARGRGWGGRILDAGVAWCRERGLPVVLHVTEGNAGARALYLSRGFVPTGVWEPLREGSDLRIEELRLEA